VTLLEDIQGSAVDANSDLGTLLRKCKLLAARLGSKPLEDWLLWESNGYPDNVSVPEYRIWSLEVKGHFAGPFGSGMRNAPIPIACLPEKVRESYQHYESRQSIASIEAMLSAKDDGGTLQVSTGDLALVLGQKVYRHQNCIQAWAEFSTNHLHELLNSVRNRVLDFALAVWKEEPTAGETSAKPSTVMDASRVTQIFNTTVYGGSANLVGSASHSTIEFNIEAKNFSSLESVLRESGIEEDDVKELKTALQSGEQPTANKGFGPRVSAWIAKMVKKAAEGSWGVGVGAAGTLLAQALSKYYGL
jgi:hypothetical protein